METSLTMLFPAGYMFSEALCGSIDAVALVSADSGQAEPLDGPVSSADTIMVKGWAIDVAGGTPAAGVLVTLGERIVEATYGLPRPDIALSHASDAFLRSGFLATIAATPGAIGATSLSAYAVSSDATTIMRVTGGLVLEMRRADAEIGVALPYRSGFISYHIDRLRAIDGGAPDGTLSPELLIRRGVLIELRGWAFDTGAARRARGVYVSVDRRDLVRGTLGYSRRDVAAANHNESLRDCGFVIRFDTSGLPAGSHRLTLGFISHDGESREEIDLPSRLIVI